MNAHKTLVNTLVKAMLDLDPKAEEWGVEIEPPLSDESLNALAAAIKSATSNMDALRVQTDRLCTRLGVDTGPRGQFHVPVEHRNIGQVVGYLADAAGAAINVRGYRVVVEKLLQVLNERLGTSFLQDGEDPTRVLEHLSLLDDELRRPRANPHHAALADRVRVAIQDIGVGARQGPVDDDCLLQDFSEWAADLDASIRGLTAVIADRDATIDGLRRADAQGERRVYAVRDGGWPDGPFMPDHVETWIWQPRPVCAARQVADALRVLGHHHPRASQVAEALEGLVDPSLRNSWDSIARMLEPALATGPVKFHPVMASHDRLKPAAHVSPVLGVAFSTGDGDDEVAVAALPSGEIAILMDEGNRCWEADGSREEYLRRCIEGGA